jgi:predicted transcriptional regulator
MESPNKLRIKLLVSTLPGIHLRELQRLLGISFNSTRYHVNNLSSTGEIICERVRGRSRLYPPGVSGQDKLVYSLLRSRTCRSILTALVEEPNLTNKQISIKTELAKSTVSEHIQRLLSAGVVRMNVSNENGVTYELGDPNYILQLLMKTDRKRSALEVATDRFIDTWDF